MPPPDEINKPMTVSRLRLPGIIFVLVVAAIVIYGVIARAAQGSRLKELTEEQAVPNVAVVTPSRVENQTGFDLPGRLEAFTRAPI